MSYLVAHQSLVDPCLEFTDPNPDIHKLFQQFNDRFFKGRLGAVEVKWSSKLTRCAGLCGFIKNRVLNNRVCTISLSEPLLKLRPRRDLVDILLHEMIHAYLKVYENPCESNHGPIFLYYMKYINMRAGTSVSVYHRFHDEILVLRKHWYRCDGRCGRWVPCLGTKWHKHCPPWSNDEDWRQHRELCGGTYRKVLAPLGARHSFKEGRAENKSQRSRST